MIHSSVTNSGALPSNYKSWRTEHLIVLVVVRLLKIACREAISGSVAKQRTIACSKPNYMAHRADRPLQYAHQSTSDAHIKAIFIHFLHGHELARLLWNLCFLPALLLIRCISKTSWKYVCMRTFSRHLERPHLKVCKSTWPWCRDISRERSP